MGKNPRVNGHNLSRLTISGGKRTEPRLMMAHPKPKPWLAIITGVALTLTFVILVWLAGRS